MPGVDYQIQRADEIHGRWQISVEVNRKIRDFWIRIC